MNKQRCSDTLSVLGAIVAVVPGVAELGCSEFILHCFALACGTLGYTIHSIHMVGVQLLRPVSEWIVHSKICYLPEFRASG